MNLYLSATFVLAIFALVLPFSLAMEESAPRLSPQEVRCLSPKELDAYLDKAKYSQEELCELLRDIASPRYSEETILFLVGKRLTNRSTKKIDDWIATEMATGNFVTVTDMLLSSLRSPLNYTQYAHEALPTALGSNNIELVQLFLLDPEVSVDTAIQWTRYMARRSWDSFLCPEFQVVEFVLIYGSAIQAIREGNLAGFEAALKSFGEIPATILNYFTEVAKAFSQEKIVDHLFVLQCDITYRSAIQAIQDGKLYYLKVLLEGFKNFPTNLLDELIKVANVEFNSTHADYVPTLRHVVSPKMIVAYLFGLQCDRITAPGCGNNLPLLMALTSARNPEKLNEFFQILPLLQGWRTETIQSHVDKMAK